MENTLISIKNLGIKYEKKLSLLSANSTSDFWPLRDISFTVKRGEVLGILGKNGAGKSTLLSLMAGIIDPSEGVFVSYASKAYLLSLQAGFVPFLTGRKNIILACLLLGMTLKEAEEAMPKIIEFADIGDFIDNPVAVYSSGMKARLGFAISISIHSDLILLDEILGVGDENFKKKSNRAMRSKISQTTTVIVSHNTQTIAELCTRVIIIHNHKIIHDGDVAKGIESYNSL